MTNEQLAQKYAKRLKKCLAAIKVFIICAIAAIAALVVFILIAVLSGMQEGNPNGLLLGVIIPGTFAVACVIGAIATLVTAKITITEFKKLGADKS